MMVQVIAPLHLHLNLLGSRAAINNILTDNRSCELKPCLLSKERIFISCQGRLEYLSIKRPRGERNGLLMG